MTKIKDTGNFDRIMAGLAEVAEIEAGESAPARLFAPAEVDVRAIRRVFGLSQDAFAMRFGLSAGSVRDWEQGRRRPDPAARTLLRIIQLEPAAVERALTSA